ncbi:BIG/ATPase V1 complex, subunit S1 [Gautieria morchelliformis]|nr:BIG/ATPase V1 complex, subunit S1 [Gautieria morchelliformis]
MFPRSVVWLSLFSLTCAYKDTVPVVAWSSHLSDKLDSLGARPEPFTQTSHLFNVLLDGDDVCQYDAVVIAEQPGLHASDLRTLSRTSYLSTRLAGAASSLQIPYMPHSGSDSLEAFKRTLADRCGSRRVELGLGQGGVDLEQGVKHVVCLSMPHLEDERTERHGAMRDHEIQLSNDITRVTTAFPTHLVLYTGSQPMAKRQDVISESEDDPSRPTVLSNADVAAAPINTTLAVGGLFQRYRFFTPGLITALLIVFGLLIPLLMVGIYALASIQSPLRMDAPKGPSLEKKNQ